MTEDIPNSNKSSINVLVVFIIAMIFLLCTIEANIIKGDFEVMGFSSSTPDNGLSSLSFPFTSSILNNTIELPQRLETSSAHDITNSNSRNISERYIVVLDDGSTTSDRQVLIEQIRNATDRIQAATHGERGQIPKIVNEYDHVFVGFTISVPRDYSNILQMIQNNQHVQITEKDQRVYAFAQTLPTGINRVDGDLSPTQSGDGSGTVNTDIAILDTGVDLDHPDLNIYKERTFVSGTLSANDDNGHGSHVAGIAAAKDNNIGAVGIAPGARIWAVKVLDSTGSGFISDIIAAIDYLTQNAGEVDVANMSFGCECESSALDTAINNSVENGITYVAAAGNDGDDASTFSPANNPNVIAVSAIVDTDGKCGGKGFSTTVGNDDSFASFSNHGSTIDMAAPGVIIYSTHKDGSYATMSGTSMASPHVAGAAGLYKSIHPGASPADIRDALVLTGSKRSTVCDGNGHGYFTEDPDIYQEPLLYIKQQSNSLGSITARQTNNIASAFAYYDVVFKTSTTGTIKTVEVKFPVGTIAGAYANFIEAEGIGPGTVKKTDSEKIIYTVKDPVSIPAGKEIRLQFSRIVNPPTPSDNYQLTVTTRDPTGNIIDGPTTSIPYKIKGIGTDDIANNAITSNKISTSFMVSRILQDGQNGWNPDGLSTSWNIIDGSVKPSNSHVYISLDEPNELLNVVCMVEDIFDGSFQVACVDPPADASKLRYTVINQP